MMRVCVPLELLVLIFLFCILFQHVGIRVFSLLKTFANFEPSRSEAERLCSHSSGVKLPGSKRPGEQ